MEVAVLRGDAAAVRRFADAVSAERGVQHGRLLLVSPKEVTVPQKRHAAE
jgi:CopG family transcriptional regulator, nickel-responsive regulator